MDTSTATPSAAFVMLAHVWPRKLTKTVLDTYGIYNTHGLLLKGECAIDWRPRLHRSVTPAGWILWCRDRKVANMPWYDYGAKSFIPWGAHDKQAKLLEAVQWAYRHLHVPIDSWVRSPFGSYVPVAAMERAIVRCGQ